MTTQEVPTPPGVIFDNRVVSWASLHPNPWNPNKMDEATYAAAVESIQTFGFVDPLTVREHPDLEGEYQIIDGYHRWKASGDLRGHDVDLPVVCLLNLPDASARKLTIILNETRGEADPVLLGTLLADLLKEGMDIEDLKVGLRYDDAELSHLLELGDVDWSQFDPPIAKEPASEDGWTTITARIPDEAIVVWHQAVEKIKNETSLHADPAVMAGQAIEILAASYLAAG